MGGVANNVASPSGNPTFHVSCQKNGTKFLVDPGSDISIIKVPPRQAETARPFAATANQSALTAYGKSTMTVQFMARNFVWEFMLSPNVSQNILGADFLRYYKLDCDVVTRCIKPHTPPSKLFAPSVSQVSATPTSIDELFLNFPDITKVNFREVKHPVTHHIPTQGRPVFAKARRLNPELEKIARKEFVELEQAGVIRRRQC